MKQTLFAFLPLILLAAPPANSQVPNVLITESGVVSIQEYDTVNATCNTQDCAVSKTHVNFYDSEVSASKLAVSGRMGRLYDNASPGGNCGANYRSGIYARVPLNQEVYIKAATTVGAHWINNQNNIGFQSSARAVLYNHSYGAPDGNGYGIGPDSGINGGDSLPKLLKVYGAGVGSPLVIGSNTYYLVGHLELYGAINLMPFNGQNPYFEFNSSVSSVEVYYKGKVLKYIGGGDQTGLVTQPLAKPLNVRVVNDDTGLPVASEPVAFTVLDPVNGAVLGITAATTDLNGLATTYLTLGSSTGTYRVRAACPGCLAAANEIDFMETAFGTALTCVTCDLHGSVGMELPTPFRFKVVDTGSGAPVSGAGVSYEVISFTDKNGNTTSDVNGAGVRALNAAGTDTNGFSRAYLTLGSAEGTYVVRARCESCLSNKEQIARGAAHKYSVITDGETVETADPYVNAPDCDSGCCPLTPVLRITTVTPPNDGVSFTSDPAENYIGLKGRIQPECLDKNNITWRVGDAPADNIDSGIPVQPTPGEVSSFRASPPSEPIGRPLPLAYKVTAGFDYDGKTLSASKTVKQDEIDKCRQEYIDFGIELGDVSRSRFTQGLDGEFVGSPMDCYAHIYPIRAEEVKTLRATYNISVNSGYRSPRANKFVAKSKAIRTSWHMFGRAIDIEVLPETAINYQGLWNSVGNPKILESKSGYLLKRDSSGALIIGSETKDVNGNKMPDVFEQIIPSGWLHLGE